MSGLILVAEPTTINRMILRSRLSDTGYAIQTARSGTAAFEAASTDLPELVLLSAHLGFETCVSLSKKLRELAHLSNVPIILLSPPLSSTATLRALEAGIETILPQSPKGPHLLAWIRNLLRRRAALAELHSAELSHLYTATDAATENHTERPGQIALVAPSLAQGLEWRNKLSRHLRDRISVLDPTNALADLDRVTTPDCFVIAEPTEDPEAALQLISALTCRLDTLRARVVLVQHAPDLDRETAALSAGAFAVMRHGFDTREAVCQLRRALSRKAREDRRRDALQNGLRLAATDPLTGLLNRRSALARLEKIDANALSGQADYAVLVLDIDHFKSVNDTYGHRVGDLALRAVAERMQDSLRQGDFMARIGGEEFLAVIQGCDLQIAKVAAERLRAAVNATPFSTSDDAAQDLTITVSIGLVMAGHQSPALRPAELIDLADRALYAAKAAGRDRVTIYKNTEPQGGVRVIAGGV